MEKSGGVIVDPGTPASAAATYSADAVSTVLVEGGKPIEVQPQSKTTTKRAVLVVSMFLTLFLPALDQTIVSTALPTILSELSATDSNAGYTWVGSAFTLAQAVVQPLFGQSSEAFGRKWTFLTAIGIFTLGSALCGASQSISGLIGARVVQGMGGGGITSLVFILIGDLVGTRLVDNLN
jgi:MFS family permease